MSDTPRRRAASAPDISQDNTANNTRIFTSTGIFVRRDLATRLPFRLVSRIVNAVSLPESLTQEMGIDSNISSN